MKKSVTAPVAIGLICFMLSFIITTQVKSVRRNSAINLGDDIRVNALRMQLQEASAQKEAYLQEMMLYKDQIQELRAIAEESSGYTKILSKMLTDAENLAGLTDLSGPGVILTVRDNPNITSNTYYVDENDLVHYQDIVLLVNELYAAGAEAISINEERLIAISEIRCVGPTVMINGSNYTPPFEIKAIGDPETLDNALNMPGGIIMQLTTYYGLDIQVNRVNSMKINAYNGVVSYKNAVPVK